MPKLEGLDSTSDTLKFPNEWCLREVSNLKGSEVSLVIRSRKQKVAVKRTILPRRTRVGLTLSASDPSWL